MLEYIQHPPKKLLPLRQSFPLPHPPLSKTLAGTNVLPVPMDCLFWTFHVNGIMQYEWLLSHTSHFHTRSPASQDNPANPLALRPLLQQRPSFYLRKALWTWSDIHEVWYTLWATPPLTPGPFSIQLDSCLFGASWILRHKSSPTRLDEEAV